MAFLRHLPAHHKQKPDHQHHEHRERREDCLREKSITVHITPEKVLMPVGEENVMGGSSTALEKPPDMFFPHTQDGQDQYTRQDTLLRQRRYRFAHTPRPLARKETPTRLRQQSVLPQLLTYNAYSF